MVSKITISQVDLPDTTVERTVFSSAAGEYEIVTGTARSESELIEMAEGSEGLIIQYAQVSEQVLDALPELRVVSRYGIGVDSIDIDAANRHGVAVTHVPSYCEEEVATHALALLLSVTRNTAAYDRQIKAGTWDWKMGQPLRPLMGRTLGFMAFGKIPRTLMQLTEGLDFTYLTHDPYLDEEAVAGLPIELVSWERLLAESDIISIHAPLVDETRGKFDRAAFSEMRDDAIIINTARGPIIDEAALDWALSEGQIAGAGIDVMSEEPPSASPLFKHDAIVISPHVAWYSERSVTALRRKTAENVVRYLVGDEPHGFVNPEVNVQ